MDTDSPDESNSPDAEPALRFLSRQDNESDGSEYAESSRDGLEVDRSSSSPPEGSLRAEHVSDRKWKQLKKHYNDGYADFLRKVAVEAYDDGVPLINLGSSQVGAVTWDPQEKTALYQALSLKGRHDLPFIAQKIGTKSELEVRDYLLLLHEKETDRHLFAKQTKSISHADIPAAAEISEECEKLLDLVADAQEAYDEYYDRVARVQNDDAVWIIDRDVAEILDQKADKLEEDILGNGKETENSQFQTSIFYVATFIKLSERIFMNHGHLSSHGTWHSFAVDYETPAFTQEAVSKFYDLVVNFTRRLMQTALFLAESRQRATTSSYYRHRSMVRDVDVAAAVDVLNVKGDLWEYWTGVARRNKLDIVNDTHMKGSGQKSKKFMSYEAVEQNLSKRRKKWRGRRRRSSASTTDISATENETEGEDLDKTRGLDRSSANDSDSPPYNRFSTSEDDKAEKISPESEPESSDTAPISSHDSSSSECFGNISLHASTPGQKRRRIELEQQQDVYLSDIDTENSSREEAALWRIFGQVTPTALNKSKDKEENRLARPKEPRKSTEDLKNPFEILNYQAEWESFGGVMPPESFGETERARKQRNVLTRQPEKTEAVRRDTRLIQDLPTRNRDYSGFQGESDIDSDPTFEPDLDFDL